MIEVYVLIVAVSRQKMLSGNICTGGNEGMVAFTSLVQFYTSLFLSASLDMDQETNSGRGREGGGVEGKVHWSHLPMMRCPGNKWNQFS